MTAEKKSFRIGVVLSTGDLRGVFAHIGFLQALEELKIPYQAMAGSSAGALVSSVVASGRTPTEAARRLEELCVSDYWKKDSFFKILYKLLLKRGRAYTGFVSTDRLVITLGSLLKVKTFEQCPIPLYIVATNITKGAKEVFHSGEIATPAVASAAIPVLFKAVRIGENYYVDGGVFDLTPRTAICCSEKLDVLIVNQIVKRHDCQVWDNSFMLERWSMATLVERVVEAIYENDRYGGVEGISLCPCPCQSRVLTLKPHIDPLDRLNPQEGKRLMLQGYEETLRLLPPLLEKISGIKDQEFSFGRFFCEQNDTRQHKERYGVKKPG